MANYHVQDLVVGGLYEYIRKLDKSELCWAYHDENENVGIGDQVLTYPKAEIYVVLEVKTNGLFGFHSVKVLSSAGTVGRLHMCPDDWKRLDQ